MVRDGRLRELERRREVAHADLVRRGQGVDDGHTGRVGEGLEPRGEVVALGLGKGIFLGPTADRGK